MWLIVWNPKPVSNWATGDASSQVKIESFNHDVGTRLGFVSPVRYASIIPNCPGNVFKASEGYWPNVDPGLGYAIVVTAAAAKPAEEGGAADIIATYVANGAELFEGEELPRDPPGDPNGRIFGMPAGGGFLLPQASDGDEKSGGKTKKPKKKRQG